MKNMEIELSIIIPVYNVENYWEDFFSNKYCDELATLPVEIILIDDFSSDESLKLISSLKKNNFTILRNENNRGPNFSRNEGIKISKGNYLMFLDSDDSIDLNKLATVLEKGEYSNYDVTSFGFTFFKAENSIIEFKYKGKYKENLDNLFGNYLLGRYNRVSWGRFYSAKFIKENNIRFIDDKVHGRDILFCAEVFKKAKTARTENINLVNSGIRLNSFSRSYSVQNILSAITIINDMKKIIHPNVMPQYEVFVNRTIIYHYLISSLRLTKKEWKNAVTLLLFEKNINKKSFMNKLFTNRLSFHAAGLFCKILKLNY